MVGIREATGNNDGPQVERFLAYVGLGKGYPWCAAFVCTMYGDMCIDNPRSAWVPDLFKDHIIWKSSYSDWRTGINLFRKGDIYSIWFASKNREAHTGIVIGWDADYLYTVDGNTNIAGSREGDGVYKKKRPKRQVYAIADYLGGERRNDWREDGKYALIKND